MEIFNQITEWANKITIWIAFATLFFTWRNWLNDRKGKVDIKIQLHNLTDNNTMVLVQTVKRKHCTRSEIQGLLRASNNGNAYNINFLSTREFSDRLESIQNNKSKILIIDIKGQTEFSGFTADQTPTKN